MTTKFRDLRRMLKDDGWVVIAQRGSHEQWKHTSKPGRVTVAGHGMEALMRYYVVFEQAEGGGWGAYPPELPGVGVTGATREEVRDLVRGAIELHLEGLREDGLPIPEPSGEYVEVA